MQLNTWLVIGVFSVIQFINFEDKQKFVAFFPLTFLTWIKILRIRMTGVNLNDNNNTLRQVIINLNASWAVS